MENWIQKFDADMGERQVNEHGVYVFTKFVICVYVANCCYCVSLLFDFDSEWSPFKNFDHKRSLRAWEGGWGKSQTLKYVKNFPANVGQNILLSPETVIY